MVTVVGTVMPHHRKGHGIPYALPVATRVLMGIQTLRRNLRARVEDVQNNGMHIFFGRHSKPVAVLVDVEWYRRAAEALGEPTTYELVILDEPEEKKAAKPLPRSEDATKPDPD